MDESLHTQPPYIDVITYALLVVAEDNWNNESPQRAVAKFEAIRKENGYGN